MLPAMLRLPDLKSVSGPSGNTIYSSRGLHFPACDDEMRSVVRSATSAAFHAVQF
jgi:hypothetical protein